MTEEAGSGKAISRRELLKRGAVGAGGLVVSGAFGTCTSITEGQAQGRRYSQPLQDFPSALYSRNG